jgi:anti-anti-sigma factor
MENPLIYVGALIAGLFLVAFIVLMLKRGGRQSDLVARSALMSLEEHHFFNLLSEAEKELHYVFPKVALAQLVEARDGGQVRWRSGLGTMAVDFAILDPHDLRIIGVVDVQEGEGKLPKEAERAKEQMDRVIESLGIPLLRISASERHTVDSLRRLIRETFPRRITPSAVRVGMDGDAVCIRLDGNAMFTSSTTFRELTREMNRRGHRQFRLDLGGCNIMDSTFIGTLLALGLQLRQQGGGMTIVRASQEVRDQLQHYGLGQVIKISQGNGAVFTPEGEWIASSSKATAADHRETILQAHEALVASSAENRLRFHDALEFLKGNVPEGN